MAVGELEALVLKSMHRLLISDLRDHGSDLIQPAARTRAGFNDNNRVTTFFYHCLKYSWSLKAIEHCRYT